MGLNLTAADAALKEYYQPALRSQINNNLHLLMQMEQNTHDFVGREAVFALHVGRNDGVGARGEDKDLPDAGHQQYENTRVKMKLNYGRIRLTGIVIESMRSDVGAWTRAVRSESQGILRDVKRDLNRQCITPSRGEVAVVASKASSKFKVKDEAQARRLEQGMRITFHDNNAAASDRNADGKYCVVDTVDLDKLEVTLKAASGSIEGLPSSAVADDFIVRYGVVPASGNGNTSVEKERGNPEIHGLEDILNTDFLHGISNSGSDAVDVWKPGYTKSGVGLPTDDVFEGAMDRIWNVSGHDINLIVTSDKVRRAYANTLKTQKRYPNSQVLKGGFKATTVECGRGPVGMLVDRDVPDETAYGLTTQRLTEFVLKDWTFMARDGAVLNRVPNRDAYEATLFKYHEMTTDERHAHFKLTGVKGN